MLLNVLPLSPPEGSCSCGIVTSLRAPYTCIFNLNFILFTVLPDTAHTVIGQCYNTGTFTAKRKTEENKLFCCFSRALKTWKGLTCVFQWQQTKTTGRPLADIVVTTVYFKSIQFTPSSFHKHQQLPEHRKSVNTQQRVLPNKCTIYSCLSTI